MRHKEPKNKEPSTPDLLNDSANVKTTLEKNRPRSCVNPTAIGYDICPNNSRIELETNRRWSGVQLGSKLMQAFDRLVFDDSDDYTDSLENNKPAKPAGNDLKVTRGPVWKLNVLRVAASFVLLVMSKFHCRCWQTLPAFFFVQLSVLVLRNEIHFTCVHHLHLVSSLFFM